jgi:hypothetical protein
MGWSNTASAILRATSVVLLDDDGNIVGTLDGEKGLVLFGNGTATHPELQISPNSDVTWSNSDVGALSPNVIEVANTSMFMLAGTDTGDSQAAALAVDSHANGLDAPGVQVWQWLFGNDQTGSGTPVPQAETWHAVTPLNGGAIPPGDPLRYRVDAGGNVIMQGELDGGTITSGTVLFDLATGYAPPKEYRIPGQAQNSSGSIQTTWTVRILPNGNVTTLTPPTGVTVLRFDGVVYSLLP